MEVKVFEEIGSSGINTILFESYFRNFSPKLENEIKIIFISIGCSYKSAKTQYPALEFAQDMATVSSNLVFIYHTDFPPYQKIEKIKEKMPQLKSFKNIFFIPIPVMRKDILEIFDKWMTGIN